MHHLILYFSYLVFPFLLLLIYLCSLRLKSVFIYILFGILISGSMIFIYARFVEPQIILTKTTKIETGFTAKIIVISDIHLGIYKNEHFLEKVVNKINQIENVDAVLIAGDLSYHPKENDIPILFSPLQNIKFPTYAVLGNHDQEHPGPPIEKELRKALKDNNVHYLLNENITINKLTILGLGDNWAQQDDISKINNFTPEDNLIVLTHNPDTTLNYENNIPDLTVTGHSHGGQIRLPYLYKHAIPCTGDFDHGLENSPHGKVFISSGLGEVGLPMRLGIPPRIDVLELY
jgi:uncharacterized protein